MSLARARRAPRQQALRDPPGPRPHGRRPMHHLCRHSRPLSGKDRLPLVAETHQAGLIIRKPYDARGDMVWANRSATVLLGAADGLSLGCRGAFIAATPDATAALLQLVMAAAAGSGGTLALPRPSTLPSIAVLAVPLSERA